MSNYRIYSKFLVKSVEHIFHNLLNGQEIDIVRDSMAGEKALTVSVEVDGTIQGEILYCYPRNTIKKVMEAMMPNQGLKRVPQKAIIDTANELSNMITGTFINQMQYLDHDIEVSPPEIQEEKEEYIRTLFETVNLSFDSAFGGFDVDFYYKENAS